MNKVAELYNLVHSNELFIVPFWFFLFQVIVRVNVWHGFKEFFLKDFPLTLQILWFTINLYYVQVNKFPHTYIIQVIIVQICLVVLSATISRYLYINTRKGIREVIAYFFYFILFQGIAFYVLIRGMGFRFLGRI
jgi:hypothetical protein